MGTMFCRSCGQQMHDSAAACPKCGAPNVMSGTSDQASANKTADIPEGVKGWSWGAFLLNWIWAIGNRTWIGLLAAIPYVGLIMAIVLGFKGREWAWKNKQWESIEQFNAVQRKWSIWGGVIIGTAIVIGILASIAMPAWQDYAARAQAMEDELGTSSSPAVTSQSSRAAPPVASSPYPLPQLTFDQADFVGAIKRAQFDSHWITYFVTYLSRPNEFWANCVSSSASMARELGGMNTQEARLHGEQSCRSVASQLHDCLNGIPLGGAILCLQGVVSDAENGE